ncbi:MAG: DciA family protein [Candidatus Peribacteraceae bacterium]|nr:DciA family protein [Candidatus Peribacteraceae bacterium]MDD5074924.1 DciA family protein [Candidatus Peribacteraceae bacterium]
MDRLSSFLPQILNKRGLLVRAEASLVIHHAEQWLKETLPNLKDGITAKSLGEDGTLLIECAHSVAAQECQIELPHLILFLRDHCGHSSLRTARIIRSRAASPAPA